MNNYNAAVSPVIATILLVGVAIGASALAYSWYTGMQKGTQEASGGVSGRVTQATGSAIVIQDVSSASTSTEIINITLKNIGSSAFLSSNVKTYLDVANGTVYTNETPHMGASTINPGDSVYLDSTFTAVDPGKTYTLKIITTAGGLATRTIIT